MKKKVKRKHLAVILCVALAISAPFIRQPFLAGEGHKVYRRT